MASRVPLLLSRSFSSKISVSVSNCNYSTIHFRKNPVYLTLSTPKFIPGSDLKLCHVVNLMSSTTASSLNSTRNFSVLSKTKSSLVPLSHISNKNQSFSSKTQTKSESEAQALNNERSSRVHAKEVKGHGDNGGGGDKIKNNVISELLSLPEDMNQNPVLKSQYAGVSWKTVYKFNHIRTARVVQRLKLYQTGFTCLLALPTGLGLYMHGIVCFDVVAFTGGACGFAAAMLYIMGNFFSKLIGYVYVSKDNPDIVRVAHMTFWGGRKDDLFAKEDFIPFSDLPDNIQDAYIHVKTYSEPENKLYLTLKYGEVLDLEEFEDIFGQVPGLLVMPKSAKQ